MTRAQHFHALERERQAIRQAEDALAEDQARLDRKARNLAERKAAHQNAAHALLTLVCTEIGPEDELRPR